MKWPTFGSQLNDGVSVSSAKTGSTEIGPQPVVFREYLLGPIKAEENSNGSFPIR